MNSYFKSNFRTRNWQASSQVSIPANGQTDSQMPHALKTGAGPASASKRESTKINTNTVASRRDFTDVRESANDQFATLSVKKSHQRPLLPSKTRSHYKQRTLISESLEELTNLRQRHSRAASGMLGHFTEFDYQDNKRFTDLKLKYCGDAPQLVQERKQTMEKLEQARNLVAKLKKSYRMNDL